MPLDLIACYRNPGFEAVADGVMSFFVRRLDLQHSGVAFGHDSSSAEAEPA